MKKLLTLLVALVALGVAAPASGVTPERQVLRLINAERQHPLELRARMSSFAEHHAGRMARAGHIFHSDLSFHKPPGWGLGAENVGVGTTIAGLHRAFMASREHRRNILNRTFEWVGIGVKRYGDRLWVTVEFAG